jgi:hypothetical protein
VTVGSFELQMPNGATQTVHVTQVETGDRVELNLVGEGRPPFPVGDTP